MRIILSLTKEAYGALAFEAKQRGWCLFRVKPKLHIMEHFATLDQNIDHWNHVQFQSCSDHTSLGRNGNYNLNMEQAMYSTMPVWHAGRTKIL